MYMEGRKLRVVVYVLAREEGGGTEGYLAPDLYIIFNIIFIFSLFLEIL